jgi:hypothetical protein
MFFPVKLLNHSIFKSLAMLASSRFTVQVARQGGGGKIADDLKPKIKPLPTACDKKRSPSLSIARNIRMIATIVKPYFIVNQLKLNVAHVPL